MRESAQHRWVLLGRKQQAPTKIMFKINWLGFIARFHNAAIAGSSPAVATIFPFKISTLSNLIIHYAAHVIHHRTAVTLPYSTP